MFKRPSRKSIFQNDPDMPYGPDDLWWPKNKDGEISVKLLIVDEERSNSIVVEKTSPPTEKEFHQLMMTAKLFSARSGRTDVVFQRSKKEKRNLEDGTIKEYTRTQTMKIARYREGEIELYCRPNWRKGPY